MPTALGTLLQRQQADAVELAPGVESRPYHLDGRPMPVGSNRPVAHIVRDLRGLTGGSITMQEFYDGLGIDKEQLFQVLDYVAQLAEDHRPPSPKVGLHGLRHRVHFAASIWKRMSEQPDGHRERRVVERLHEAAPALAQALKELFNSPL